MPSLMAHMSRLRLLRTAGTECATPPFMKPALMHMQGGSDEEVHGKRVQGAYPVALCVAKLWAATVAS